MARASLRTIYYVYFRDAAEQKRYWPIYSQIENEKGVSEARKWLVERKRLSSIPLPKTGRLGEYARAVEAFCGVPAGSLLVAQDNRFITFAKGASGRIAATGFKGAAATEEQFECVMRVTAAADLRSRGIFFGFVGTRQRQSAKQPIP